MKVVDVNVSDKYRGGMFKLGYGGCMCVGCIWGLCLKWFRLRLG